MWSEEPSVTARPSDRGRKECMKELRFSVWLVGRELPGHQERGGGWRTDTEV